jgi:predicted regulator of Ras-like GTPase activity (Roadblock/LC7/MglB family)
VISELEATIAGLIDHVVDGVPGVLGAVIASADGFVLGSRVPDGSAFDAAAIAAMSAATLALSNRLIQIGGDSTTEVSVQRATNSQVWIFGVGSSAALTIVATSDADSARIDLIGNEVSKGLAPLFD